MKRALIAFLFLILPSLAEATPSLLSGTDGLQETQVTAVTSITATLPTNIVVGNLLICVVIVRAPSSGHAWNTASWTSMSMVDYSGTARIEARYRFASGSDVAPNVTWTTSAAAAFTCIQIQNAHPSSAPEGLLGTESSTSAPDPPSITASWSDGESTLYIAGVNYDVGGSNATVNTYPSNYTDNQDNNRIAGQSAIALATRSLTKSGAENPGTFGLSASDSTYPWTIAVRPSGQVPRSMHQYRLRRAQ